MNTISISSHKSGQDRAIVIWYWADEWSESPSDSCRMFWFV